MDQRGGLRPAAGTGGGLKTLLTGRPDLPRLDVTAAELPPGGCVVHTPEGMVDASVDTQLGNLAALFQQPR